MIKEIQGLAEFRHEIGGPGLVVVDFFATWCGPCKQIAPFIDSLVAKYPEVKFIKVDIDHNKDIAGPMRISSVPTFHFYVNGALKDEIKGANPTAVEQKVMQYKISKTPFGGSGFKLQAKNAPSGMNAREARLKQFAGMEGPRKESSSAPLPTSVRASSTPAQGESEEEAALAQAMAISLAESQPASAQSKTSVSASQEAADYAAAKQELARIEEGEEAAPEIHIAPRNGEEWEEEMVPVPVSEELLSELLDMGFSDTRARKGLVHGKTVDGALSWIDEHQEDADIDQPYMVRKVDTLPRPVLSAEEKARRLEEIKDMIKTRREERAKHEKVEEIRREKERRERGQKMDETLEERQRLQRKREAERLKKEKDDAAKERARLKAEIARDKEIRRANKGVMPSVLGVGGYNPSAIQYDQPGAAAAAAIHSAAAAPAGPTTPAAAPKAAPVFATSSSAPKTKPRESSAVSELSAEERVDQAIATIARYRTGGDGGQALKLLLTFVRNIAEHPNETKYRSVNLDSAAFKAKLASLVGPMNLLRALGFEKDEAENKLKFEGDAASVLMSSSLQKLAKAEALYRQMNP